MAIKLGKEGVAPPKGAGIINATFTEECEAVEVTNRGNHGGATGKAGYRCYREGFKTRMWEVECHDPTGLITSLENNPSADTGATGVFEVMNVSENISIDGAVTFTVSLRET